MKSKKKHMLNILFYVIFSLCSYLMVYVVYLTMLNYVPLLCSLLVLLDYVCIFYSTLLLCPCWILYPWCIYLGVFVSVEC